MSCNHAACSCRNKTKNAQASGMTAMRTMSMPTFAAPTATSRTTRRTSGVAVVADRCLAEYSFNLSPAIEVGAVREMIITVPAGATDPRVDMTGKNNWLPTTQISPNTFSFRFPTPLKPGFGDVAVQVFYYYAPFTAPLVTVR